MFREDEKDRIFQVLHADSESIKFDDDFIEKSFERLQAKMHYVRNVRHAGESQKRILKWPVSIAAAAAVFVVMFLPVYYSSSQNTADSFLPITSTALKPIAKSNVIMDSSISSGNFAVAVKSDADGKAVQESEFNDSIVNSQIIQNLDLNEALTSVDVFKNKVEVQPSGYDFSVSVPETHTVKNSRNIQMPKNRFFGR